MSHANARLTFLGRCLLVRRIRVQQRPVAHVAKEMGVSRQCAHSWVARFDAEGWAEVITDNAFAYRHSLAFGQAAAAVGARQLFIKPHCPWQNGKVERFNRTLQTEWAYSQIFTSNCVGLL